MFNNIKKIIKKIKILKKEIANNSETVKTDNITIETLSNRLIRAEDRIKTLEERQKVHRIIIGHIKDFVGITKK
tara:strand:+ start:70 stop:291 length:222 start_codon:yes stop_codon:yes gene_type:complete